MELGWTPYPWKALQKIPRTAIRAIRGVHALLRDPDLPRLVGQAAGELLEQPALHLVPGRIRMTRPELPVFSNGVVCLIANQDRTLHTLIDAEPELAHRIASTLLSRPPSWVNRAQPTPPTLHAAFGAFLIAVVRSACTDHGLHLVAVGPPARQGFRAHAPDPCPTLDLAVAFPDASFGASVAWHASTGPTLGVSPFHAQALLSLGSLPLALPLVAAISSCTRAELSSLEVGDAWMPADGWSVQVVPNGLQGEVLLMSPASEFGLRAELRSDGKIVLREGTMRPQQVEQGVPDSTGSGDVPRALADAPVVVRVEVGAVTLTAREWSVAQPGDILTTGRLIAERVSLRVGGIEVARGELVDVEGEVGVRIHEIVTSKDGGA